METFTLSLPSALAATAPATSPTAASAAPDVICGIVASGNLEILVEPQGSSTCTFEIHTAAEGFRETWDAVLADFVQRHPAGGLRFTLNDVGSTPAVVALRLAQAHELWLRGRAA